MKLPKLLSRWAEKLVDARIEAKTAPNFGLGFITSSGLQDGDYLDVAGAGGKLWSNSAVMACMAWFMDTLPEARPIVKKGVGADAQPVDEHAFLELVKRPFPGVTWSDLVGAIGMSLALDGNAYLRKRRMQNGALQLEFIPYELIEPKAEPGRESNGAAYYEMRGNGIYRRVELTEIIHFRRGIDPDNTMKGISRAKSVRREIMTDSEATVYDHSILRNMGVLGYVIGPKEKGDTITPEVADKFKEAFMRGTTGEERGKPHMLSLPVSIDAIGRSPAEMGIRDLRKTPEERTCAVFRVPPMVVGLGAGLERSTFSNMKEAREMAVESANCPLWSAIADTLTLAFSDPASDSMILKPGEFITFDLSTVRALQEDENDRATRAELLYRGGVWKRSESRQYTGKEAATEDEVYLTDIKAAQAQDALAAMEARNSQQRAKIYEGLGSG
jgi:HK97 family phage portal protein